MAEQDELIELSESVARLVRGAWDELESVLVIHTDPIDVAGTKATLRCHYVRSDPNKRQRVDALARLLVDQLVHYCIPRSAIVAAQALPADRQVPAIARLARDAAKLFTTTQAKTGEGAELLLYAMLEKGLGIPQVLSKMSHKTSTEMQIHGADGVHAQLLDDGNLAIYWGEAKLYEDVSDAMAESLNSLKPYLDGSAAEQDLFLLRHHLDAGDAEMTQRLLEYFDDRSAKSANVEVRGACLIGFSHANYPCLPHDLVSVEEALNNQLAEWTNSMSTRLKYRTLEEFVIEVFFVPLPSASDFRIAVSSVLGGN